MATFTLRADPETEAALAYLGATPGTRSRVIREAILALADWHRTNDVSRDPRKLRQLAEIAELQRHLESIQSGLNQFARRAA